MKKKKKYLFFSDLKNQIREDKVTFAVYTILRLLVIASMVLATVRKEYESLFVYTLTLLLFIAPAFIERKLNITLPTTLEIIIMLFIFSAEVLGEINNFYMRVPYWDTMLHTINGFLFAAVGFSLLDIINRSSRLKFELSPMYLAIVAFCFSMTIGVLWEFFEFFCDLFLGTDMQKDFIVNHITSVKLDPTNSNIPVTIDSISDVFINGESLGLGGYLDIGIFDTMKDLFVNFIGAVVFSIIGFFYVKRRGKGKFAEQFIPKINTVETELNDKK